MTTIMPKAENRSAHFGGGILLGISAFLAAVGTPVSVWAASDISVAETLFPTVWDLAHSLLQFLFIWVMVAFLSVSLIQNGMRGISPLCFWFAGASAVRCIGSLIVGSLITSDAFNADPFLENLLYGALDMLFDFLLFAAVAVAVYLLILRKSTVKNRNLLLPPASLTRPFTALHGTVLLSVALLSLVRLVGRIRYDVFFGTPQNTSDLLWMVFFYAADLATVAIGYFLVLVFIRRICNREKGVKTDELPL